jgi:hypothetical protein
MANETDTTFSSAFLQPDSLWMGGACTGANSTGVVLKAIGNGTVATMTPFTLTSSLPVDLTLIGLVAGNYTLTVGGVTVFSGAVSVGDTTIYANSVAGGVVALTGGITGVTGSFLGGAVTVKGPVVIH